MKLSPFLWLYTQPSSMSLTIQLQEHKYERAGQNEPPELYVCRMMEIRFHVCLKADSTWSSCLPSGPLSTEQKPRSGLAISSFWSCTLSNQDLPYSIFCTGIFDKNHSLHLRFEIPLVSQIPCFHPKLY